MLALARRVRFSWRSSPTENLSRVRAGLRILEDHAVDAVTDHDVARYAVVRVADEVVVDLRALSRDAGIRYETARRYLDRKGQHRGHRWGTGRRFRCESVSAKLPGEQRTRKAGKKTGAKA